ncbi:MAG TPA: DNA methyltransferase, partial [Pirellula sp.]|nr:DNA methyltransferase [Pirellula sp.]
VVAFLQKLSSIRVLDPACGSGNFLYVAMEHMKWIEGEVLNMLHDLGDTRLSTIRIDPHQFLGIEVNPRAAAIADLVLWIGFLQCQLRTFQPDQITEPLLENYHNIDCRDAVLAWDRVEEVKDDQGKPVTRWDGRTMKKHPVTGEDVPDDTARVPVLKYINPRKAEWPDAEFIVGNPPFIGNKRMRFALGDGYAETLRKCWSDVSGSADFVMYWWHKAGKLASDGKIRRFGLVTTNSITQSFNRQVIDSFLHGSAACSLVFAIPDHPWIDSSDGAAVRIAMTVGQSGKTQGRVEAPVEDDNDARSDKQSARIASVGIIAANLRVGAALSNCVNLESNRGLAFQGPIPVGEGFRIEANSLPEFGLHKSRLPPVVHRYIIGRDLMQGMQERYIIDFFGLTEELHFPTKR